MANSYDIGSLVRVSVQFTDVLGNPADPSMITLRYEAGGVPITQLVYGTDAAVIRDGIGAYHADLSASTPGTWPYRWVGGGALQAVFDGAYVVSPSPVA